MLRCSLLVVAALALSLGTAPAHAQKETRADVSSFAFVTGPKGDRPSVPGLNTLFQFTEEQKEKLVRARQETLGSPAVLTASRKVKADPGATEADRQAVRKLTEEAQALYERRVAEILTPAQKERILSLQVLYGQSRESVTAEYAPRLVNSKGNPEETQRLREQSREALTTDFMRRLREFLTPEQYAALERAAAEEKQREAAKSKDRE